MKKTIKNLPLLIGTVALATLPITSTISCSKNNNNSSDNNGGNIGSGGDTSKPNNPSNPANKQEILNHTNTFSYEPTDADPFLEFDDVVLLRNFDTWKQKILNNQVKFFNEDGTAIKYDINIHFDAGMKITFKEFNVDPTKPPVVDLNYPWGPDKPANNYKIINEPIDMKLEFYKKENNNSFTTGDFIVNCFENLPYKVIETNYLDLAFPLEKNVVMANVNGSTLDNSKIDFIAYIGLTLGKKTGIITLYQMFDNKPENWNEIKSNFNSVDSTTNNLMIQGPFNEDTYPSRSFWGATNVVGSVSITNKRN